MDKMDLIHRLREARRAHTQWVGHARGLINGVSLDKGAVPVSPTDCAFGAWYYGDGQTLSELPTFRKIETLHTELHNIYMEIFRTLFKETEHSLPTRLFGRSHELTEQEKIEEAKKHLFRLEKVSHDIVTWIHALEDEICAMNNTDFTHHFEAKA